MNLEAAWDALRYGGAMVYPLLLLGVVAVLIILDRAVAYYRCLRLPRSLADLVETYGFSWDELDRQLTALAPVNAYGRFFAVIGDNRNKPAWWVESRAGDEAGGIEKVPRPRPVGAGDRRHRGAADGPARNDHRHDASVQSDRRLGPGRADAGDLGRGAGADRDRAGPADRDVRAVRLQLFRAHAIAGARPDGAAGLAADGPYPPGPGNRREGRDRQFGDAVHAARGEGRSDEAAQGHEAIGAAESRSSR